MRYVVLIMDGASGLAVEELDGRTSLEAAATPNLDRLAREGAVGLAHTVPEGLEPSSAVACMSVLGFDPTAFYAGRGPIEAMAMGIDLEPGQVAMRCNFVTVLDGTMVSYSAGNITAPEAAELLAAIDTELGNGRLQFHPGVGFRSVLTVREGSELLETTFTAPHDITDRPVAGAGPVGPGSGLIAGLMERSKAILADHPVNKARVRRGLPPATQIWLFWPGTRPGQMPTFLEAYGKRAALTSAVDLLRGLAVQTGVDFLDIPGVTDESDNDYYVQMEAAIASLDRYALVFVHVEAPDDASHAGNVPGKVKAIEHIDALMVGQVLSRADAGGADSVGEVSLLVLPDHPTPLALKTHVADPVPFVLWGPGFAANGAARFTEAEARATGFAVAPGHLLIRRFLAACTPR
jgi:2,3-bisphosphoglycerate-independent phosphoglycerate mutase